MDGYPGTMRLAVGDVVVYPSHGVGSVVARESRPLLGEMREVVVLDLIDGLAVTLPVEKALKVLRPVLSEAELQMVQKTLRESDPRSEEPWPKRRQAAQEKMAGGDPRELAEIVRDAAQREQRPRSKGGSLLSSGEKTIYTKARRLLAGEISVASGLEPVEADGWIDQQLGAATAQ
jgi:CarD family transcriptional regulator